ncbi:hypothetical protein H257_11729 [Aphanomyces astaci]|uniref:Importin N-terminal domain-containing protein n=1 Tax=Aphanomyces astaci TaxID=112090 RepID=W4G3L8_APHAT|nr:hypothetical protein H257_11729 [Aphanomyces astaci]ETV73619.1 hypothetical protein H257_11729 [Aphanomyces astaci]|eukprot:XP_009837045.1 hypothetical protein H257_11729 [Aphanomyces astaci]
MSYASLDEALDIALGFSPKSTPEGRQLAVNYLAQYKTFPYALQFLQTSTNEKQLWFATSTLEELVRSRVDLDCSPLITLLWSVVMEPSTNLPKYIVDKLRLVLVYAVLRHNSLSELCVQILDAVDTLQSNGTVRQPTLDVWSCLCEEMSMSQNESTPGVFVELTRDRMAHHAQFEAHVMSFATEVVKLLRHFQHQVAVQSPSFSDAALATTLRIAGFISTFRFAGDGAADIVRDMIVLAMEFAAYPLRQHTPSSSQSSSIRLALSSNAACNALCTIVATKWPRDVTVVVVNCALDGLLAWLALLSESAVQRAVDHDHDDAYLDTVSAFVETFLSHHLRHLHHARYIASLSALLGHVVTLTSLQPHVSGLFHCLTVWEVFVSHVEDIEENEMGRQSNDGLLRSYEVGLVGVMQLLVERILFASNGPQLGELDEEEGGGNPTTTTTRSTYDEYADKEDDIATGALVDQDQTSTELSDLKAFVFECFSLVRRITRLPGCAQPLLTTLLPSVKASVSLFKTIHHTSIPADGTAERHAVHDLTVQCALLSCVSAQHVTNSNVVADKSTGWDILVLFVDLAEYITTHRVHTRGAAFVDLECEVLSCVRLCMSCVPFVYENGGSDPLKSVGESMVRLILATLDTSIVPSPLNVMQSALNLLAGMGSVFPYAIQVEIPSLGHLYANLQDFCLHLSPSVQCQLYTALAHNVLSTGLSVASFSSLVTPVLTSVVESVVTMQQNAQRVLEPALLAQLMRDISICRALARVVLTKPKQVKLSFYSQMHGVLPYTLDAVRVYMNVLPQCPPSQLSSAVGAIHDLIGFYSDLFRSIRKELPTDVVGATVTTLVELFQHGQFASKLEALGAPGTAVLCAFLKLLRILVEEYSPTLAGLLHR